MSKPILPAVWFVGRTTPLYGQIVEATAGAAEAGKDISESNWVILIRAYTLTTGTAYVVSTTGTKASASGDAAAGDSGYFTAAVSALSAAYDRLIAEIVLQDTGNVDANTPSGKREYLVERREIRVVDAAT
jgi:hypothetical protein